MRSSASPAHVSQVTFAGAINLKVTNRRMDQNLNNASWMVHWPARTLTSDRQYIEGLICEVMKGGFAIKYPYSLAIGSQLNVEFYVTFNKLRKRIRAKTKVTHCQLGADNSGALIDLKITQCSRDEMHTLNNILMTFIESDEVDLRVNRKLRATKFP